MNICIKKGTGYRLFKDFISLVTNRGLDSLIGIIIIPYLILKIGSVEYGKIVLAQSIVYLGVAFVNYGFDLLILKKIPLYRYYHKVKSISIFVSRVILLKLYIFLLYILIYLFMNFIIDIPNDINIYILILSLLCFSEILSLSHVLVVFQDVKILPIISIFRFVFLFVSTYLFVHNSQDSFVYIFLYSFSYFISNIIVFIYIVLKYRFQFYLPKKQRSIVKIFINSSPFFISKINLLLSDKLYNILSATFISLSAAAFLDISFKVLSVIIIPVQILSVVILGRFSMRSSGVFVKKILFGLITFSLILLLLLIVFRVYILNYYSFLPSLDLIIALIIILSSSVFANLSIFIGDNIMVAFSLEKELIKSSIYSSFVIFPILITVLVFVKSSLIVLSLFFLVHKLFEFALRLFYTWNYIK